MDNNDFFYFFSEIFVLDQGRVRERGTHQKLLELDGLYAKLWAAQSKNLF